jgi:hypothetical protein
MASASSALHDSGRLDGRTGPRLRPRDWALWRNPPLVVGVVLLVTFVVLFAFMLSQTGRGEIGWTRLVLLYGTVQAVLFAALGTVFGRELVRQRAEAAERLAARADERTDQVLERIERLAGEAANGRALAAILRGEAGVLVPPGFSPDAATLVSPATPEQAVAGLAVRLRAHAEELFPAA